MVDGFRIRYTRVAVEDFDAIPANMDARIRKVIETRVMTNPQAYGAPLRGNLAGLWKIRIGDFRIVSELDEARRGVTVWGIRHRRRVYPENRRRWISRVK